MAETTGLPALTGSDRQVAWAADIRNSIIHLLNDPHDPQTEYIAKASLITDSRWWIDNRHLTGRPIRSIKAEIRAALRRDDDQ